MLLPCFISTAQKREFMRLADLASQSIQYCRDHGVMMARRHADDFGHDAEAMERVALELAAISRTCEWS